MSICKEKQYIVIVWKDMFRWIENRVLKHVTSVVVVKFLWKNIIIKYKVFNKLICVRHEWMKLHESDWFDNR